MKPRDFEITIQPDGSVEIHVHGYQGKGCVEAAKIFERVLGDAASRQFTSEYYDPEEQVQYRVDQRS